MLFEVILVYLFIIFYCLKDNLSPIYINNSIHKIISFTLISNIVLNDILNLINFMVII